MKFTALALGSLFSASTAFSPTFSRSHHSSLPSSTFGLSTKPKHRPHFSPLMGILDEVEDENLFKLGGGDSANDTGLPTGIEAAYDAFLAELVSFFDTTPRWYIFTI